MTFCEQKIMSFLTSMYLICPPSGSSAVKPKESIVLIYRLLVVCTRWGNLVCSPLLIVIYNLILMFF